MLKPQEKFGDYLWVLFGFLFLMLLLFAVGKMMFPTPEFWIPV